MVRRIRKGLHPVLGESGIFISKPGRDVDDTSTNFLLDSRFRTLSLHANGLVQMSRSTAISGKTIWYAEVSFPDLGYRPIYFGNLRYDSANFVDIPVNSAGIPISYVGTFGRTGFFFETNSVWLVNNTTLRARAILDKGGGSGDMTFIWTVFKNRFE